MTDICKPGDLVVIRQGPLPCSEFRPFEGARGTVSRVFTDARYPILVQLKHLFHVCVYMPDEVEVLREAS